MRLLLYAIEERRSNGARECRRGSTTELLQLSACRARGWWEKFSSLPFGPTVYYITFFFILAAVFKNLVVFSRHLQ